MRQLIQQLGLIGRSNRRYWKQYCSVTGGFKDSAVTVASRRRLNELDIQQDSTARFASTSPHSLCHLARSSRQQLSPSQSADALHGDLSSSRSGNCARPTFGPRVFSAEGTPQLRTLSLALLQHEEKVLVRKDWERFAPGNMLLSGGVSDQRAGDHLPSFSISQQRLQGGFVHSIGYHSWWESFPSSNSQSLSSLFSANAASRRCLSTAQTPSSSSSTPVRSPLLPPLPRPDTDSSAPSSSPAASPASKDSPTALGRAILTGIKQSPKKVNLVASLVRGMRVEDALTQMAVSTKRAAVALAKVINSAAANGTNNHGLDGKKLFVAEAFVGKGVFIRRLFPHARGKSGMRHRKRCQLTVIVKEMDALMEARMERERAARRSYHRRRRLTKLAPHDVKYIGRARREQVEEEKIAVPA
eukprot:TRINITY_DN2140_c0_g1_i1.p1 TRINITY_DN2140_c0_g1~~TRINITY_DN2140_c0_g1_i1.p1  ORF type:complete len:415 (+),score=43.21 TRINITY_DN2140_c0_g1_i1:380-1624(+)